MTITLYTKDGCHGCRLSKRYMDKQGIAYNSVDVYADETALDTIRSLGYQSLPVIVIADQNAQAVDHWSGYQPDRLGGLVS